MRNWLLVLLIGMGAVNVSAEESQSPITVVELFTSQGCYSCPPADDLLAEIDNNANTITLSCHVTYWNYLGWRDTFAQSYCDNRQRVYQSALVGNRGVYTPQMVINGRFGTVGSRVQTVGRAIEILERENRIQPLGISLNANRLFINLPTLSVDTDEQHQLILLGTTGTHEVPISRGENGGKTLQYHNPIEVIENLGRWSGDEKVLTQRIARQPNVKEWVVLAQTWPIGEIVAAGKLHVQ